MANLPSTVNSASLPALKDLKAGMQAAASSGGPSNRFAILRLTRSGEWVYGGDNIEVADDSQWAVNPLSFVHGWIAWGDAEVLGEKMVSIAKPLPSDAELPDVGAQWQHQMGVALACVAGSDKGAQVRYETTSVGGLRAMRILLELVADRLDGAACVPVIALDAESYHHKKYGKTFNPVFDVLTWVDMDSQTLAKDADADADDDEAVAPPPTSEPVRRRRRR